MLSELLAKLKFEVPRIQFKEMRGAAEPKPKNQQDGKEGAKEEAKAEDAKKE